jgi:hypothetical protein
LKKQLLFLYFLIFITSAEEDQGFWRTLLIQEQTADQLFWRQTAFVLGHMTQTL